MNILNIDSTSKKMYIALSQKGYLVSFVTRGSGRKYMEMIIGDIDRVLKKAGIGIEEVDAVGVNKGPGDFTGTRIGISVVKTMGWVLEIPAYGINALDVAAHSVAYTNRAGISKSIASGKDVFILPCLDVKKDELYFSWYKISGPGNSHGNIADISHGNKVYGIRRIEEMILVSSGKFYSSLENRLSGTGSKKDISVFMGGNCLSGYEKMLSGITGIHPGIYIDRKNIFNYPGSLDACVRQAIRKGISGQRVNPVYVRDFVPFGR